MHFSRGMSGTFGSRVQGDRGVAVEDGKTRWADYGIHKIAYDRTAHRITQALVVPNPYYRTDSDPIIMERAQMVDALQSGNTFVVVEKRGNMWRKGAEAFLVDVEGDLYIRTRRTKLPMDSREQIPEFDPRVRRR